MNPETHTFGGRVRMARESRGLSLQALGDKLNLGTSYLSDVERGRRTISESSLERLCKELGLDVEEMAALAGIIGQRAELYLQTHPAAVALVRQMARENVPDEAIVLDVCIARGPAAAPKKRTARRK